MGRNAADRSGTLAPAASSFGSPPRCPTGMGEWAGLISKFQRLVGSKLSDD